MEDVKFKPRDDDYDNPGTPRSPLPGGLKHHEKKSTEEQSMFQGLKAKINNV